ncbi:ensconsin-like isoform X1 [Scyliorhinus canicula]|uniref:ensconsin-like isoform X1 n=1 Tax=Scyliorhinus canicula TaxID=7830 RepID=UPI0018F55836|nr:ensconsin-like isoform X1 [Scyliorhinus canicula]
MAEAEGVASRVDGGDGIGDNGVFFASSVLEQASEAQVKVEDQKGQLSSHSISTTGQSVNSGTKQDLPVLRVDDKQRLAKERREVRQKQQAAREQLLLEKEEKARQHYEKQLEERKKKIEEQRLKEDRRRTAVEEKRNQRLQEEKERHEAVVRRTIERSQRIKQKSNRWSWGGALQSNTTINRDDADRRSVSTMNLAKHADSVINKRLSSSSATLLNSPDRALRQRIASILNQPCKPCSASTPEKSCSESKQARRLQLSPWESSIVTRLLTPTHSFLARSRSTAALYGNGQDAVIPICPRSVSASSITPPTCKNLHGRMSDWPRFIVATPDVSVRRRPAHPQKADKKEKEKENEREKNALIAFTADGAVKKSNSALNVKNKSPVPSTVRSSAKTSTFVVNAKLFSSLPDSVKGSLTQRPPSPGNVRPVKTSESEKKDEEKERLLTEDNTDEQLPVSPPTLVKQPLPAEESATKPEYKETVQATLSATPGKTTAGTTDPAEATRLLTEKRRIAREQRDREEEEKREQEERERQMREEMLRRKSEEKARREEEARRLEEERRLQEEQQKLEEEHQFLEEKAQREKYEIERLQKQKEEDARAREEAERLRIEREKHFQKEEQERMERKKRLEQIMKRTRRSDMSEKKDSQIKSTEQRNGEVPKLASLDEASSQNPDITTETMSKVTEEEADEESVIEEVDNSQRDEECPVTEKIIRENGVSVQNENFEDFIDLSLGIKATRIATETSNDEGGIPVNPIIAFEENGSMELLTKVDGIQTQQTAEVI